MFLKIAFITLGALLVFLTSLKFERTSKSFLFMIVGIIYMIFGSMIQYLESIKLGATYYPILYVLILIPIIIMIADAFIRSVTRTELYKRIIQTLDSKKKVNLIIKERNSTEQGKEDEVNSSSRKAKTTELSEGDDRVEKKLDVVLTEYRALRNEIDDYTKSYIRVISMYASAILVFYGLTLLHKEYDIISGLLILAIALLLPMNWIEKEVKNAGQYIFEEIEDKKIPLLIGNVETNFTKKNYQNLWMGWEHCLRDPKSPLERTKTMFYCKTSLFILAAIPVLFYNFISVTSRLIVYGFEIPTKLPLEINFMLLIFNLCFVIVTYHKIIRR